MNTKLLICAAAISFGLAVAPANAGQLEDGVSAYGHRDYTAAFNLLKPLARNGNAIAQFNIALMYDEGNGVPQSYANAFKWYLRAAESGLIQAQYTAGYCYRKGRGIKLNVVRAHMWLNLAASGGLRHADIERDQEQLVMTRAQIAEAQERATAWRSSHRKPWNCGKHQCPRPSWLPKPDWYSPFYWQGL